MPNASVKVMLSYDYCHFEVALSSDVAVTLKQVNALRKNAQRLADEAVRQYKEMKRRAATNWEWERRNVLNLIEKAKLKPRSEWTPEDKAVIKLQSDKAWAAEQEYDYDDDDEDFDP